jgi:hypothetical protein
MILKVFIEVIMVLKLTDHKNGLKMEGFLSLNTAPSCNDFCNRMKENKSLICSRCYGVYMQNRYPHAKASWTENFSILTSTFLSSADITPIIKRINSKRKLAGMRIHSVGELFNDIHAQNIQNIIKEIKVDIPVTIWTKRLNLIEGLKERLQCSIIYSNPVLNTFLSPHAYSDIPVLHTFNVYDDKIKMDADMHRAVNMLGIDVAECRGQCNECMICYPKYGNERTPLAIFELTKRARGKTHGGKE